MKFCFTFVALTFNVNSFFSNLFTAPFEVLILSRALDVSTQEAAVCLNNFIINMETNAICKKCSTAYVAPHNQLKKKIFVCQKCKREKMKEYRLKRKLQGNPVISTKMPKEYFKEYHNKFKQKNGISLSADRNRKGKNTVIYKEKEKIRLKIRDKIKTGELNRMPCQVCGNIKSEIHHIDYNKPNEILWLCKKHHLEWHYEDNKYKYNIINILKENHSKQ